MLQFLIHSNGLLVGTYPRVYKASFTRRPDVQHALQIWAVKIKPMHDQVWLTSHWLLAHMDGLVSNIHKRCHHKVLKDSKPP